jgi:oligopeptide transport system permease protein
MTGLVLRRAAATVLVILVVASFGFWAMKAAPGGPFDTERRMPAEVQRNVERAYHLDWPATKQYRHYLWRLLHGDLGPSMRRPGSVNEIIAENFPRSLVLGLLALAFAVAFGMGLGLVAAARQNRTADRAAMALALVGVSIPAFVLGPLLIYWFALRLGWLPAARWDGPANMILPAATLGLIYMGAIARLTRGGMVEILRQDFVRTARAKGLGEAAVVLKHALRLGVLPVVTYLGPAAAALVTGSVVVELVFQVPGLGWYFVSSVTDRDYPVLCGVMVVYCSFLVLLNLLVDLAYGWLDPRIRHSGPAQRGAG